MQVTGRAQEDGKAGPVELGKAVVVGKRWEYGRRAVQGKAECMPTDQSLWLEPRLHTAAKQRRPAHISTVSN